MCQLTNSCVAKSRARPAWEESYCKPARDLRPPPHEPNAAAVTVRSSLLSGARCTGDGAAAANRTGATDGLAGRASPNAAMAMRGACCAPRSSRATAGCVRAAAPRPTRWTTSSRSTRAGLMTHGESDELVLPVPQQEEAHAKGRPRDRGRSTASWRQGAVTMPAGRRSSASGTRVRFPDGIWSSDVFPVLPFEGATVTYGTRPDIEFAAAAQGLDHQLHAAVLRPIEVRAVPTGSGSAVALDIRRGSCSLRMPERKGRCSVSRRGAEAQTSPNWA